MSNFHRVIPERNLVAFVFGGRITVDHSIALLQSYSEDALADPSNNYLLDFSGVTHFDITFREMMVHVARLLDLAPARDPKARTSVFAPGDVAFGVARMFQSLADTQMANQVEVFRTRVEALAFLDCKDDAGLDFPVPLP